MRREDKKFFILVKIRLKQDKISNHKKDNFSATDFQLLGCVKMDHQIFALPLQKVFKLIWISKKSSLKVAKVKNMDRIRKLAEFKRLLEGCQKQLIEYLSGHIKCFTTKEAFIKVNKKSDEFFETCKKQTSMIYTKLKQCFKLILYVIFSFNLMKIRMNVQWWKCLM